MLRIRSITLALVLLRLHMSGPVAGFDVLVTVLAELCRVYPMMEPSWPLLRPWLLPFGMVTFSYQRLKKDIQKKKLYE